ncbi:MAG: peptidyl-prolyl cis-trans isomerase [Deltaproteobacteria bacterium]|nr:peptidyl-prolyl cis-trans isomerase [Deltaproteobacteria bacterium]
MKAWWITAILTALLGCGDGGQQTETSKLSKVNIEESSAGRLVVATIDGAPVFGDCVADQMTATAMDRRQALDSCIEFELLARAAYPRFGSDPEVHETGKSEAVRALIDHDFVPTADEPDDVPAQWLEDNLWKRRNVQTFFNYPENRVVAYALAKFQKKMVDSAHDAETRALAEAWARALAGKRNLAPDEFERTIRSAAKGSKIPFDFNASYQTPQQGRSVPAFANATFALDVGETSPVVKSRYGYFVILLRSIIPAKSTTFEQAVPIMRKQVFSKWQPVAFSEFVEALAEKAEVVTYDEVLAKVRLDLPSDLRVP